MASPTPPRRGALRMALFAALIGGLVLGCLLTTTGGDPLVIATLGEPTTVAHVRDELHRDVATRPDPGHDGQAFLLQAWDPLFLKRDQVAYMDRPVYRGQRMMYPLIAGLGGAAPKAAVPWLMLLTQWAALIAGTYATARLAVRMGGHERLGLAFLFSPAILAAVSVGGAGVVALAAALLGTLALEEERPRSAAAWFVVSVLSREVLLLYVAGVALLRLVRTRRLPWGLALPSVVAVGGWRLYLVNRLGHVSRDRVYEFGWPFKGFISAVKWWNGNPLQYVMIALLIFFVVAFCAVFAKSRPSYVGWGSAGFVLLAPILSVSVWRNWFDIHRGVLPIFTALVLMWGTRERAASVAAPEAGMASDRSVPVLAAR